MLIFIVRWTFMLLSFGFWYRVVLQDELKLYSATLLNVNECNVSLKKKKAHLKHFWDLQRN